MVLQIYFPNKDIYLYNFVTIKDMVCVPIQGKILEMLPDDTFIFFIECPPPHLPGIWEGGGNIIGHLFHNQQNYT